MIIKNKPINVPYGIRFLSDWKEFNLSMFPSKCIINKQLPGCGFTEYCISCSEDIILCSPRKKLIKNKYDQHENDVYLVIRDNESDLSVDNDISISKKINNSADQQKEINYINTEAEIQDFLNKLKSIPNSKIDDKIFGNNSYKNLYFEIRDYCREMNLLNKPYKILVTYDSYRLVREILINLRIFDSFKTVIDEFQSILHDSRFKSNTELSFLEYLKISPTAYFVSATPMMEEYLNMLTEFDGLPYFELDWKTLDPNRVMQPNLKPLTMKSTGEKINEIIQKYLSNDFKKLVVKDKNGNLKEVVSDEAVFYVNSVNHIIVAIKRNNLTPEQVTILCSDTKENKKKVEKKLGKKFLQCISDIPLRGVKPKMFTFCTRTVYLGADFYSTCASTYIFSDANIDSLAVDISDDLPQILGRQRLDENPWRNEATIYYRTICDWKSKPKSEFDDLIETKKRKSNELLTLFNSVTQTDKSTAFTLAETCESAAKADNYKNNYISVNRIRLSNGTYNLIPVFNNLVLVNEIRAFNIAQIDYKDRFTVFSGIRNKFGNSIFGRSDENLVTSFLDDYEKSSVVNKYKLLCENDLPKDTFEYILNQIPDSDIIKSNYITLGPDVLKATCYKKAEIEKRKGIILFKEDNLISEIFHKFSIGDFLPLSLIKEELSKIYKKVNYEATPKAINLGNYFELKLSSVWRVTDDKGEKKKIKYYKLLSIKPEYLEIYNRIKATDELAKEFNN